MPKKLTKASGSLSSTNTATTTTSAASSDPSSHAANGASVGSSILSDGLPLPRLIVFDLDYTLWPFWVDTHVTPPLRAAPGAAYAAATDKVGDSYAFYAEVPAVLLALSRAPHVRLGVASRTHAPDLAREMLKLLHVADDETAPRKGRRALDLFDAGLEIYPGAKTRHLDVLAKRAGVVFADVLFFDDESRNRDVETLGVTMWLVRDGITWREVEKGVREWRSRRGMR